MKRFFILICLTLSPQLLAKPYVVVTTTQLYDAVKTIGGSAIHVEGLMGPGVDPHLYKAKASDVMKLMKAQVVFYHGIHLEGKMLEPLKEQSKRKVVVAVAESLAPEKLIEVVQGSAQHDPHTWFDPILWLESTAVIVKTLSENVPKDRGLFTKNFKNYQLEIEAAFAKAVEKLKDIPKKKRVLVTSHDAFNYFGKAFGFEVLALQGISTVSEAGLADVKGLTQIIQKRRIPAVFVETSVSPRALEAISEETGAKVGGTLYSDALGATGETFEGFALNTLAGVLVYNAATIAKAFK